MTKCRKNATLAHDPEARLKVNAPNRVFYQALKYDSNEMRS